MFGATLFLDYFIIKIFKCFRFLPTKTEDIYFIFTFSKKLEESKTQTSNNCISPYPYTQTAPLQHQTYVSVNLSCRHFLLSTKWNSVQWIISDIYRMQLLGLNNNVKQFTPISYMQDCFRFVFCLQVSAGMILCFSRQDTPGPSAII